MNTILTRLLATWEKRQKDAPPVDQMLINRHIRELREAIAQPVQPENKKLWLWKNFVDGKPEYWAFDNAYPVNLDCGDPQTLGEPCGYALLKPSRCGRTDANEEKVLKGISDSAQPVQPANGFKCEPQPAVTEDGFCEWVCPKPLGYLMQCCDCGLIHEVETRVAKYTPRPSEEFVVMDDPDLQVQLRMKRRGDLSEISVAQAEPLSDEQIDDFIPTNTSMSRIDALRWMGRAVERAHGIKPPIGTQA